MRLLDSPALRDEIIEAIKVGVPLSTAWVAAGLGHDTWLEWLHVFRYGVWRNKVPVATESLPIIKDFWERVERARAEHEQDLVRAIHHAAVTRNEKTGIEDWRAGMAYLRTAKHTRDHWHEWQPDTIQIPESETDRASSVRGLSEAKLIELAGDEFRELLGEESNHAADP